MIIKDLDIDQASFIETELARLEDQEPKTSEWLESVLTYLDVVCEPESDLISTAKNAVDKESDIEPEARVETLVRYVTLVRQLLNFHIKKLSKEIQEKAIVGIESDIERNLKRHIEDIISESMWHNNHRSYIEAYSKQSYYSWFIRDIFKNPIIISQFFIVVLIVTFGGIGVIQLREEVKSVNEIAKEAHDDAMIARGNINNAIDRITREINISSDDISSQASAVLASRIENEVRNSVDFEKIELEVISNLEKLNGMSLIPLVPLDQHLVRSMVELHGDAEERSESRLRRLTSVEAEHEFVEIAL